MSTIIYPRFKAFSTTGLPLNSGYLYTLAPGTSWPAGAKYTYTDKALTVHAQNPINLDANGEAAIYGSGQYKLILKTHAGVTLWTLDNVDCLGSSTSSGSQNQVTPMDYGAVGDGNADDTAAVVTAIAALPASGGTIFLPSGYIYKLTSGITTGTKMIRFLGEDWTAGFKGTGFTLLTLAAPMSSAENFTVLDPTGNASTVGIYIYNGTSSMYYPVLDRLHLVGTGKLGTAIKLSFALDGNFTRNGIELWGKGIEYNASGANRCNANDVHGNTFYENHYSVYFGASSINEAWIHNNTLEGANNYGIYAVSAGGVIHARENHFECVGETGIFANATDLVSSGNFFSGHSAYQDIVVFSGANLVTSDSDTFDAGVQYNGTGMMVIREPKASPAHTGTGKIRIEQQGTLAGQTFGDGDWLNFSVAPALNFGGATTGITYATGGQVGKYRTEGKLVFCFIRFALSSKGSATGVATIGNLPLTSVNLSGAGMGPISYNLNMASITGAICALVPPNSTWVYLFQQGSTGSVALTDANFSNSTIIDMMFTYQTP